MKKTYQHVVLNQAIIFCIVFFSACPKSFGQATYTWNKTGVADWTVDANWTPARITPAVNDILVFNNGTVNTPTNIPVQTIGRLQVSNTTTVNFQAAAANTVLTIAGIAPGDDLQVAAGSSLNINGNNVLTLFIGAGATALLSGNSSFSTAAHRLTAANAGAISFNSPAVFTQDIGCSGNVFTNTGTAAVVVFNAGTTFLQKDGANPFGLTQPASKVVFNTGSLFKVQQLLFLSFSGRTYANLEIDYPSFNQSVTGVNLLSIDDITITRGTLSLNLTGGITIKGNVQVAAAQALNFNAGTAGSITFNGTTAQTISSSGTLFFNSNETVVFNNANGITINNSITCNSLVNFIAGIITIPATAELILSATASVSGVSNNSFVDGRVKKIGNTAFLFPVGRAGGTFTGYVPIRISAPGAVTDTYTAEYKRQSATAISSSFIPGLDHVSGVDYWEVNRTSGSTPVDITLYWTNESSSAGAALYINDLSKLVVAHYNGSSQWDAYGGSAATGSGFAAGSITWAGVNSFNTAFALGSTDPSNPLPVYFNVFNGYQQQNNHYLHWQLQYTEAAPLTIALERSADNLHFNSIANTSAGALRCRQAFEYTDSMPLQGNNYYRLKITGANAATIYSKTIALQYKPADFIVTAVTPSPVHHTARLGISSTRQAVAGIIVTDMAGRQLQKLSCPLTKGNNYILLPCTHLPAGIYQLTVYTAGSRQTLRFTKQ